MFPDRANRKSSILSRNLIVETREAELANGDIVKFFSRTYQVFAGSDQLVVMLQVGVGLVPIISLYVAKRASSNVVRIRAILAAIAGGFLYLLWYAPTILINANITDFQTAQFGIDLRDFLATRVENTVTGLFWGILLSVNLVIAASGTRIRKLYAARKWVTILFWIATAYIILGEALSVVGNVALHGLVIPAITTALNWGQEIVEELI